MEKIIEELKQIIRFKDTTYVGDVILIVIEKPQTMMYGVVTDFSRDESKVDEWWHVTMKILGIPLQEMVWTLRTSQFTGMEIFTMGGEKRFVKALDLGLRDEKFEEIGKLEKPVKKISAKKISHLKVVK